MFTNLFMSWYTTLHISYEYALNNNLLMQCTLKQANLEIMENASIKVKMYCTCTQSKTANMKRHTIFHFMCCIYKGNSCCKTERFFFRIFYVQKLSELHIWNQHFMYLLVYVTNKQSGYCKNDSTVTAMGKIVGDCFRASEKSEATSVALLDFLRRLPH